MRWECALVPRLYGSSPALSPPYCGGPRAEKGFRLHTLYNLPRPQGDLPLFHVHGEARVPNTVILGHYYYGNLLFCCDEYLTHRALEQRYPCGRGMGLCRR